MKAVKHLSRSLLPLILCTLLLTTVCMATNTYAEAGAKWILDGIFWIVLVAGISVAAKAAISRNMVATVVILLSTGLLCMLCNDPLVLERIGTNLKAVLGI